ncbi:serpin B6 [Anabrus simplex]|uniref:serpin B6 n=1 Tax=Anabrus simplex TaxID=316456 RepID=UPI0035A3B8AC
MYCMSTYKGIIFCLVTNAGGAKEMKDVKTKGLVAKISNDFGSRLYQVLKNESSDLLFSPLSVEIIMLSMWRAAGGKTEKEIGRVLGISRSNRVLWMGFRHLMRELGKPKIGVTVSIANKLYIKNNITLKEDFKNTIKKFLYCEAEGIDFGGENNLAADTINGWIERKTNNMIKNVFGKECLTADAVIVLVNALYFRGNWSSHFNVHSTTKEKFFKDKDHKTEVEMMSQESEFSYAEREFKILKMNYTDGYSMLILLPNEVDGITNLENSLPDLDWREVNSILKPLIMKVHIPKFKIEAKMHMTEKLKELGMSLVFSPSANLSRMSDQPSYVTSVVQKTLIDVRECGTEAAAASVSEVKAKSSSAVPVFRADHPFIFAVQHEVSGVIIFLGRYSGPTSPLAQKKKGR